MVTNRNRPRPQDPRALSASPAKVQSMLDDVLSRDSHTLSEEARNLEEAYRILNDALA